MGTSHASTRDSKNPSRKKHLLLEILLRILQRVASCCMTPLVCTPPPLLWFIDLKNPKDSQKQSRFSRVVSTLKKSPPENGQNLQKNISKIVLRKLFFGAISPFLRSDLASVKGKGNSQATAFLSFLIHRCSGWPNGVAPLQNCSKKILIRNRNKKRPETSPKKLNPVQLPKSFSPALFAVLHPQFQTQSQIQFHFIITRSCRQGHAD